MIPRTCIPRTVEPGHHRLSPPEKRIPQRGLSRWVLLTSCCALVFLIVSPVLSDPVDLVEIKANIAPVRLGNITVGGVSLYGAQVSWVTDIPSDSWIYYDTVSHRKADEYTWHAGTDIISITHQITLSGLKPATLYYFRIASHGPGGVPVVSGELTFRTLSLPPTGGGGGGGGAYGSFFSVIPFTSPTTITPTPTVTPPPTTRQYEPGVRNLTDDNRSIGAHARPTGTPGLRIPELDLFSSLIMDLWLIITAVLILLALIIFVLFSRRRRED